MPACNCKHERHCHNVDQGQSPCIRNRVVQVFRYAWADVVFPGCVEHRARRVRTTGRCVELGELPAALHHFLAGVNVAAVDAKVKASDRYRDQSELRWAEEHYHTVQTCAAFEVSTGRRICAQTAITVTSSEEISLRHLRWFDDLSRA